MEALCPRLPAECRNMIEEYLRFDMAKRLVEKQLIPLRIELTSTHTVKRTKVNGPRLPIKIRIRTAWTATSKNHFNLVIYYDDDMTVKAFHSYNNERKEIASGSFVFWD